MSDKSRLPVHSPDRKEEGSGRLPRGLSTSGRDRREIDPAEGIGLLTPLGPIGPGMITWMTGSRPGPGLTVLDPGAGPTPSPHLSTDRRDVAHAPGLLGVVII